MVSILLTKLSGIPPILCFPGCCLALISLCSPQFYPCNSPLYLLSSSHFSTSSLSTFFISSNLFLPSHILRTHPHFRSLFSTSKVTIMFPSNSNLFVGSILYFVILHTLSCEEMEKQQILCMFALQIYISIHTVA